MDDNAVHAITELAQDSMRPSFIDLPGRDTRRCPVDAKGVADYKTIFQDPRSIECSSVLGLCGVLSDYLNDSNMADDQVRVAVSEDGITAVLDERGDRSDKVRMVFDIDKSWSWLNGGVSGLTQSELVWAIRSLFPDRVTDTFLPLIRELKFKTNENGDSKVSQGRETVDLSIETEITGKSGERTDIPETVVFDTPVFVHMHHETGDDGSRGVYQPVECAVLVNTQERTFTIQPLPGQVEGARKAACGHMVKTIVNELDMSMQPRLDVFEDTQI